MEAWNEKKDYKETWCQQHDIAISGGRDYEHEKQLYDYWIACNNRLSIILTKLKKTADIEDVDAIDRGLHLLKCDTAILKGWMAEDPVTSRLFDTEMKHKKGEQANGKN